MATVAQFNQDPNQPNQGGGGQVLNSTGGGGATGVTSGGSAAPGGTAFNAPRATLSGAPNIQQYLQANQGAGQQLSSGIQNQYQNQANSVNQNLNTYQNQLNTQYQPLQQTAQAGGQAIQTAFQDPQQLLNAYQGAQAQSQGQALTADQQTALNAYGGQQGAQNAYNAFETNVAGSAQNQQQQQNLGSLNTAFQQDQGNLQNQLGALQQTAGSATNEMGRTALLQNAVGQPGYSMGQQNLDQLFLQAQPGVTNQLQQNLNNVYNQTAQGANAANSNFQTQLNALQGLASSNQQNLTNTFTGGLNQISGNVANEYAAAQAAVPAQQQAISSALQSNTFTPDQLQTLGLTAGQRTWGLTPQDIMNAGAFTQNPLAAANQGGNAQVATPAEFARYNALNQLAGGPAGTLQSSIFGGATSAGGFNPVSFDANALQKAINQKQQAVMGTDFQTALKQTQAALGSNYFNQLVGNATTPEQAEQAVQQYINKVQSGANLSPFGAQVTLPLLNNFQNYYNTEFLPAATSTIGTNYTTNQLPTVANNFTPGTGWDQVTFNPNANNPSPGGAHAPIPLAPGQQAATQAEINSLINSATAGTS